MATTEPNKAARSEKQQARSGEETGLSPVASSLSPEVVKISHACGHVVHCPREFMPPGRLKRERARNCRSCRKIAREVAALRNRERGLPALDEGRGTRDQILLAEELRDRFAAQFEGITIHPGSPAEQMFKQRDPIYWIAQLASEQDCLLETRGPEVCGRACAGEALAADDARFERIFGEDSARRSALGARPGQEQDPVPSPLSEPSAERRAPSAAPKAPRACNECGVLEDDDDPLYVTEGRLLCCRCMPQEMPESAPAPAKGPGWKKTLKLAKAMIAELNSAREEEEPETPEDRGECLCVGCGSFPCRCDPFSDEPASPPEEYEIDPEGPRACEECGLVEGPGESLDVTAGRLLCYHCTPQEPPDEPRSHPAPKVALIGLARIQASPLNPRKRFDEAGLEELAASIREHGVMQPLVVRQEGAELTLIAGERRLRAAKLAGLLNVPVIVREADDATTLALMLCENLQRENLNPIEEAQAYQGLRDLGWTLEQIGAKVGRSGPAVSNAMRLLALPEEVRGMVGDGRLSAAHGRALLAWANEPELCQDIARQALRFDWTSKATEAQGRLRKADLARHAAWKAETASRREMEAFEREHPHRREEERAIASAMADAEIAAEAGSKGGAAGPEAARAQPLAAAWETVDERQAAAEALRQRERQEYEEARAQWPARATDLGASIARERGRAGSILTDPRAVALLAYNLLQDHRLSVLQEVLTERGQGELLRFLDWSADPMFTETWAALAALPVEAQLELAFEALMREEIHLLREGGAEPEQSAWYVGDGCAAASEVEA